MVSNMRIIVQNKYIVDNTFIICIIVSNISGHHGVFNDFLFAVGHDRKLLACRAVGDSYWQCSEEI